MKANKIKWSVVVPDHDGAGFLTDFCNKFYRKQVETAKGTIGKRAVDLTQDELFAVAIIGGARLVQIHREDGRMTLGTEPCIIRDREGGGFAVVTKGAT